MFLTQNRALDRGNANPRTIGSDFNRLQMPFLPAVKALDARNEARLKALELLNAWRNAIAHQDWLPVGGNPRLLLSTVRTWRSACRSLAHDFDRAVRIHLQALTGVSPW